MFPRVSRHNLVILIIILLLSCSEVNLSLVGQTIGGEHHKNTGTHNAGEVLKQENHKVENVNQNEKGLTENKQSHSSDSKGKGYFLDKSDDVKSQDESSAFGGKQFQQKQAEDSQNAGYKKGHKKGHHKQGFHNSYHKDETSDKSTYFDDFSDEGNEAKFNSHLDKFNNQDGKQFQGGSKAGQQHVKNNFNEAGYNRHGDVNKHHADHNDYGRKHYVDNRKDYVRHNNEQNMANRDQHYGRETKTPIDHGTPLYYDGHGGGWDHGSPNYGGFEDHGYQGVGHHLGSGWSNGYGPDRDYGIGRTYSEDIKSAPTVSKTAQRAPIVNQQKTITIYEDPRYDHDRSDSYRYESVGQVQLNVRPSDQRYTAYDDYYERPRTGVGRRSQINRLVYNYNRQK